MGAGVHFNARKPTIVQAMAMKAATRDSPATKPEAMGMVKVSALRGRVLSQAQAITAPLANASEFWNGMTQERPSPMAEGRKAGLFGASCSRTGMRTPMTAPMPIAQIAVAGNM